MNYVAFLPTMPPTVNNAFATVRGRRVLTKSQRDFRKVVSGIVYKPMPDDWEYVNVKIVLIPKRKMRFDVDNRIKPTLDALTSCGFWKDDSQVASVFIQVSEPCEQDGTIIVVEKADKKYRPLRDLIPKLGNAIVFKCKQFFCKEDINEDE